MKGCTIQIGASMYTVYSVHITNRATYTGIAFITATSRIKLNDVDQSQSNT